MGLNRRPIIELPSQAVETLRTLPRGGVQPVRVVQRARTLLLLDEEQSPPAVTRAVGITAQAVRNIGWRYRDRGLERALPDLPRPGGKPALDGSQSQRFSHGLRGPARWFCALERASDAEEAVKRKLVGAIGREIIRMLLLNHDLKPWREKSWCIAELDQEYIEKMEDVLAIYEKPLNPAEPGVCLDEKPVTLHDEVRPPRPAAPGHIAKRDSEYERCGTANVLCAVEPKAGRNFTWPTPDRCADRFAMAVFELAMS